MAPRYHSSALQVVQLVKESAHGAGGTANHQFAGLKFAYFSADGTSDKVLPSGNTIPTGTIHGKEWSAAPFSGMGTFADLVPLFDSALIVATPSGSGPYTRVWTPLQSVENVFGSWAAVQGDANAAYGYSFVYVDSLKLDFARDKTDVSGQVMGALEVPGASLAGSPTIFAATPIQPQQGGIWVSATGFAGTYARLPGQFALGLDLAQIRGQVWTLDDSVASFTDTVVIVPNAGATLSYAADIASGDYYGAFTLAKWRASQTVYVRYLNTYDANHSLQIDMALQLVKPAKSDKDGVFSFDSAADFVVGDSGKWIEATIISQVASY